MKFLDVTKDGGPDSTVWAHWLIEIKGLFSIVFLRFEDGSRDAYHSHAFNSISWVLRGFLIETFFPRCVKEGRCKEITEACSPLVHLCHFPSVFPVVTRRSTTHKVTSEGRTWVLSLRGPWSKEWREILPDGKVVTLTHGRKEVT